MGKIQLLSEAVASRIAAGEVVERPASIIKELLENAVDAHATAIAISILEGGIREIRVSDNGEGIASEDMPLCIVKHATSKIFTLEDLNHINSMGFRGEALASIAAVSMLTIKSRTANSEYGNELYVRGGKVEYIRQAGLADGTTVIVENLFYNTPARLKFLKKPAAETALISDIVARLILANPQISFRYTVSDKVIFHSPGNGSLADAISSIYGFNIQKFLIPINTQFNQIFMKGYIGAPTLTYKTQKYATLLINGRYIKNSFVQNVILRAYGERLMKHNFPFYVLQLTLPAEDIDVNVHPNKLSVHFRDENELEYILVNTIDEALRTTKYSPALSLKHQEKKRSTPSALNKNNIIEEVGNAEKGDTNAVLNCHHDNFSEICDQDITKVTSSISFLNNSATDVEDIELSHKIDDILNIASSIELKKKNPLSLHDASIYQKNNLQDFDLDLSSIQQKKEEERQQSIQPVRSLQDAFAEQLDFKILGVAFDTYIIIECGETLYLIDQHAAHERKIYDTLMQNLSQHPISQNLLTPIRIEITPTERFLLQENLDIITAMGFTFQTIEENYCEVNAYPQVLGDVDIRQSMQDMISSLEGRESSIQVRKDKIAKGACKRAIKAGMRMSEQDIRSLVMTILSTDIIPHCPHGRPLAIALTKKELEDGFKRRV